MKISVLDELETFDGKSMSNKEGNPMTFEEVFVTSLTLTVDGDKDENREDRYLRWKILKKIHKSDSGIVELTSEECTLLKNRVEKVYLSAEVYGNVCDTIDG